jgi:hypothetical protein
MTLHPIPSEFSYYARRMFCRFFFSVAVVLAIGVAVEACLDLATLNCTKLLKETAQGLLIRHSNYSCTADFENEGYSFAASYRMGHFKGYFGPEGTI